MKRFSFLIFFLPVITGFGQEKPPVRTLEASRTVSAPADKTWAIVNDVDGYHRFAPNIDQSAMKAQKELGMERSCSNEKGRWTEVCTLWQPGEAYKFKVNTEAEDYPYPLQHLTGYFKVEELGPELSKIVLVFEYRFKSRFMDWLGRRSVPKQFRKVCEELLDNWEREILHPE